MKFRIDIFTMIKYVIMIVPMLIGMAVIIQTGANAQLRVALGSPLLAALVSFTTGALCVLIINLVVGTDFRQLSLENIQNSSWWMWLGGFLGSLFIISAILIAPRLGPTQFFGFIIAAQLVFSVIVDHYGWLGFNIQPANFQKIAGVVLLAFGAFLIQSARN
jgi:transporter family-2 protein